MDSERKETKHKLKQISSVKDFTDLLDATLLTEDERAIVWKIYKDGKTLDLVEDELGVTRITAARKHRAALHKIGKMIK